MRAGLEMGIAQENWKEAAKSASNLSELELTLGRARLYRALLSGEACLVQASGNTTTFALTPQPPSPASGERGARSQKFRFPLSRFGRGG